MLPSQSFTGIPEADVNILSRLPFLDILRACSVDTYARSLCEYRDLWRDKLVSDYGETVLELKHKGMTYKQQYFSIWNVVGRLYNLRNDVFENPDKRLTVSEMNLLDQGVEGILNTSLAMGRGDILYAGVYTDIIKVGMLALSLEAYPEKFINSPNVDSVMNVVAILGTFKDTSVMNLINEAVKSEDVNLIQWILNNVDAFKFDDSREVLLQVLYESFKQPKEGVLGYLVRSDPIKNIIPTLSTQNFLQNLRVTFAMLMRLRIDDSEVYDFLARVSKFDDPSQQGFAAEIFDMAYIYKVSYEVLFALGKYVRNENISVMNIVLSVDPGENILKYLYHRDLLNNPTIISLVGMVGGDTKAFFREVGLIV